MLTIRYISPREAVIVSYCCGCACACVKAALGRPFSHASPHPQSPSCFARVQMFRPKLFCFEKLKYMLHKSRGELSCNTCWMNHICFSGSRCSSRHRTIGCGPILEIGHEPNFCNPPTHPGAVGGKLLTIKQGCFNPNEEIPRLDWTIKGGKLTRGTGCRVLRKKAALGAACFVTHPLVEPTLEKRNRESERLSMMRKCSRVRASVKKKRAQGRCNE